MCDAGVTGGKPARPCRMEGVGLGGGSGGGGAGGGTAM